MVKLLIIANNDLPSVEYRYEKLKTVKAYLKAGNQIQPEFLRNESISPPTTQK